MLPRCAY